MTRISENDGNEFGMNLKHYRELAGLTQEELAECIDKSTAFISSLECGYKSPSYNTLKKLSECLNIPTDALISKNHFEYSDVRIQLLGQRLSKLPEKVQTKLLDIFEFLIDKEYKE
ncbi:MAG: helix-turn-helix transcriptional regulator [Lachnospiraceae bacterium]|nr:helix-turn-helix transcriptional regulator [Lachnospiraceae bacterium]MBR6152026.1 helix-turn-helix transcriptional regulator [Lachnospiraceae bacterium]